MNAQLLTKEYEDLEAEFQTRLKEDGGANDNSSDVPNETKALIDKPRLQFATIVSGAQYSLIAGLTLALGYLAAIAFMNRVDARTPVIAAEAEWSHAQVGVAAELLGREVNENGWSANRPVWHPQSHLRAMPAFQAGIADAIGGFMQARADVIDTGTLSESDLARAARLVVDANSENGEDRLTAAIAALERHDGQLALSYTSNDKISELSRASAEAASAIMLRSYDDLAATIRSDQDADALVSAFYRAKGRAYASAQLLRATRLQYKPQIMAFGLDARFDRSVSALEKAAAFRSLRIVNPGPNALLPRSNPLMMQAYLINEAQLSAMRLAEQAGTDSL